MTYDTAPAIIKTMEIHRPVAAQISPEWKEGYWDGRNGQPQQPKRSRDYQEGWTGGVYFNGKLAQAVSA